MAGNQNSGGMRPTASQNNPANISATGGNGQSGNGTQAARYIPGMKNLGSTGVETMSQQTAAPMAGSPAPQVPELPPITPLSVPTQRPDEHIATGMPFGPGMGPEALNLPAAGSVQYQNARDAIQSLANDPDAGPAIKYLADKIGRAY